MSRTAAVAELRFGSRLSVFLRSLNILRTLSDFLTATTEAELAAQINNTLTLMKAGTRLTPSETDDNAIAWLQGAVANPKVMGLLWAVYQYVKPQPVVPNSFGAGPLLSLSELEEALNDCAAE